MTCQARRVNDQMICPCGRQWDVNDPEPPKCNGVVVMQPRQCGKRARYLGFIERVFGVKSK